jgi:hypothetical protein
MMVQRVLSAQNLSHARAGTLLASYLKTFPLFMIIIPGMISRAFYANLVTCNQPAICQCKCHSKRSCTSIAYTILILRILPRGLKGIMLLLHMIFEFSKQPPLCGENDTKFWFIRRVHYIYYAMFLFWITFLTCVIVSVCTEPPTKE